MSGGKGGGSQPNAGASGSVQTSSTSNPWAGQAPYLSAGFQQAGDLYNKGGPQYYPGSTYAPATPAQTTGLNNIAQLGQSGTQVGNAGSKAVSGILGGDNSGGYFDALRANVMPGLQSQFAGGNRMDSGLATRAASGGMTDAILGRQLGAASLAPQYNEMAFGNQGQTVAAGGQMQGLDQQSINDALQRFNYGQQQPYNNLNNYMHTVGGASWGGSSTQTQPYFQNTMGQIGGAASGLGSLASSGLFSGGSGKGGGVPGSVNVTPQIFGSNIGGFMGG